MPIHFHNADICFSLKQKRKLKQFLHHQITKSTHHQIISIDFIFCSDDYLLDINRSYLKHDYYTDIITFDLSEDEHSLVSEIYISVDRVKENAIRYSKPRAKSQEPREKNKPLMFESELHRIMFHGVLHLLGYKDKTQKQREEMRKMEDKWLKAWKDMES